MIKSIQEGYNLLFLVFVIICLFGNTDSKELEGNYTPVSINNIEVIRTESNTEWGSISDQRYKPNDDNYLR